MGQNYRVDCVIGPLRTRNFRVYCQLGLTYRNIASIRVSQTYVFDESVHISPVSRIEFTLKSSVYWPIGGAVAEWVRALACTGDRTVLAGFESHCGKLRFGTLAIPFTPRCQCLSEETLKSRRSLLSGVYARGSKRSHQSALECV